MTHSLPINYFSLTGSGSVSQLKVGISTANWGGNFNHHYYTTKAVVERRGLYPIIFGQHIIAINHQPLTINYQLSTINYQHKIPAINEVGAN